MQYLEITDLKKKYGKSEVLKGVSFGLDEGEVLSIIGSSGGGKTTLLRCINFLELADSGTISLKGETIYTGGDKKKIEEDELRKLRLNFGLVFQSFNLFPQYTALDNIKLPLSLIQKEYKKKGLPFLSENEVTLEALDLLKRVGLEEKKDAYPCELSGGQNQRVAIARAIAMKPSILCFDEPTSALDPELTGEVLKVITDLKKKLGITMIIVTHEMEFAKKISDKVIYISDGKIEEMGTPESIFENPKSQVLKLFLSSYSNDD